MPTRPERSLAAIPVLLIGLYATWRSLTIGLTLSSDGVAVANHWSRKSLNWDDIVSVISRPFYIGGPRSVRVLAFKLKDGSVVGSQATYSPRYRREELLETVRQMAEERHIQFETKLKEFDTNDAIWDRTRDRSTTF
jgi:hypothetical protein